MWVERRGKQSVEGVIDIKTIKQNEQHLAYANLWENASHSPEGSGQLHLNFL